MPAQFRSLVAAAALLAPSTARAAQRLDAVVDCAFPVVVDKADLNVAYPDTNATYWAMPLDLEEGDQATVTGQFPYARYMSFSSYTFEGTSTGGLRDNGITADEGSYNPFTEGVDFYATPRAYTVQLQVTSDPVMQSSSPNTIDILPGPSWLIIRTYVPVDYTSLSGSVPLPSITITKASSETTTTYEGCTEFKVERALHTVAIGITKSILETALPPATNPEFAAAGGAGGLFPNPDNKYIYATTTWQRGRIIVMRGLAPTYPDTPSQSFYPQQQLRYWSLCTNLLISPAPVVQCAHDSEVTLDSDGYYTFVISASDDRPSDKVLARNSATYLPWFGDHSDNALARNLVNGSLILRNMLPSSTFTNAVQDIGTAQSASAAQEAMGTYYPQAVYCSPRVFERSGTDGCFAQAASLADVSPHAFAGAGVPDSADGSAFIQLPLADGAAEL